MNGELKSADKPLNKRKNTVQQKSWAKEEHYNQERKEANKVC
jgi:hypothetical protein